MSTSASLRGGEQFIIGLMVLIFIIPDWFNLFHRPRGVWWESGGFFSQMCPLFILSLIKSVSCHNSPGLRMSHRGVGRIISSSQGCHMAHEMGTSFTSAWVSPALAIEEAVVFILSCRTLLWPYENSVSDSEFCIFFVCVCDTKSSKRIKRDVTRDLEVTGEEQRTRQVLWPECGCQGRTWGIRESPQSQGSRGVGESWSWEARNFVCLFLGNNALSYELNSLYVI